MRARMQVVDLLLASRQLIGDRKWGMAQLYYRAGLSHREIGDIFGLTRQAVTGQLRRAVKLVARAAVSRQTGEEEPSETPKQQVQTLPGDAFCPDQEAES